MRVTVEVAVDSARDGEAAASAGADRLEVCVDLGAGGLSALIDDVRQIRSGSRVKMVAMARPRGSGFFYDPDEFGELMRTAGSLLDAGADGIVFGCLDGDGRVDVAQTSAVSRLCGDRETVFHRAFDLVEDSNAALDVLIDLGITRVLTAGMSASATAMSLGIPAPERATPSQAVCTMSERLQRIAGLVKRSRGHIEILPGGGVRSGNAAEFLTRAGCTQVHTSARDASGALCVDEIRKIRASVGG